MGNIVKGRNLLEEQALFFIFLQMGKMANELPVERVAKITALYLSHGGTVANEKLPSSLRH